MVKTLWFLSQLAEVTGFEPVYVRVKVLCLNQTWLYPNTNNGKGDRSRTHIYGFGDRRSTIELHLYLVKWRAK